MGRVRAAARSAANSKGALAALQRDEAAGVEHQCAGGSEGRRDCPITAALPNATAASPLAPSAATCAAAATPPQAPTARNAVHKYGSWARFFQHHSLDLLALQVRHTCWSMGRQAAQAAASSGHPRCLQLPATNAPCQPLSLQESKAIDEKLTKELACVDGFQSFWACSRCTGELPRLLTHASSASVRWHACIQG